MSKEITFTMAKTLADGTIRVETFVVPHEGKYRLLKSRWKRRGFKLVNIERGTEHSANVPVIK